MNNEINLITRKDDQSLIEKRRLRIIRTIAYVFAGVVVLFAIVIFIVNATLSTSRIKKEQQSAISQMGMLKDKSAKLFVVNNRITNIRSILKTRSEPSLIVGLISAVPENVNVSSVDFNKKTFSLTVSSSSLLPLDGLIDKYLNKIAKNEAIKSLTISSLSLNQKSGLYYLSLKADLL